MAERILVTGGAGYVGSHACRALHAAGFEPVCYDSLERGHRAAVQWGPFEQGDLLDRDRLRDAILRHRPAAVMHFAALACVGESVEQPARYYRANVAGSLNLIEARNRKFNRRRAEILAAFCWIFKLGPLWQP